MRLISTARRKLARSCGISSPVSRFFATVRLPGAIPAQFTRTRSMPFVARASASAESMEASSVTSARQKTPPMSRATASPRSAFISRMATFTPLAASMRAVASPRPEAPPVTTAAINLSSFIAFLPVSGHVLRYPRRNGNADHGRNRPDERTLHEAFHQGRDGGHARGDPRRGRLQAPLLGEIQARGRQDPLRGGSGGGLFLRYRPLDPKPREADSHRRHRLFC